MPILLAALCLLLLPGDAKARKVAVRTASELTAAVRDALPHDTVLLEDGVYALSRYLQIDGKTDLTLASRSQDASKAILKGKGFASRDGADDILRIGSSKRIRIENLGFEDCHSYGIKLEAEKSPEDISIRGCAFLQIGTRHIKGSTGQGTRALRGEIVGCSFRNTQVPGADWQSEGNYIAAIDLMALDGWTISDNVFRDVKGRSGGGRAAIFVWVGSRNVTVERNRIIGCDRGIALGNPSPSTNGADLHVSGSICRNNFIVAGPDAGIELAWVEDVKVVHNTIWRTDATGRGIRSIENVENTSFVNNLIRGRLLLMGHEASQGNLAGALDGLFRDPAAGDLHLLPGASAAIDQGVAAGAVDAPEDCDRERRPSGSAPDIGADEWMPVTALASGRPGAGRIPRGRVPVPGRDWLGRLR